MRLALLKQHDKSAKEEASRRKNDEQEEQKRRTGRATEPKEIKMRASEAADKRLDELAKVGHDMVYSKSGAATCQKCGNRACERNVQCWLRSEMGKRCNDRLVQKDDEGV